MFTGWTVARSLSTRDRGTDLRGSTGAGGSRSTRPHDHSRSGDWFETSVFLAASRISVYTPYEEEIRRARCPIGMNAVHRYSGRRYLSYRSRSFSGLRRPSKSVSGQSLHSSGKSSQRPYSGVSRGRYDTPLSRCATGRDVNPYRFGAVALSSMPAGENAV